MSVGLFQKIASLLQVWSLNRRQFVCPRHGIQQRDGLAKSDACRIPILVLPQCQRLLRQYLVDRSQFERAFHQIALPVPHILPLIHGSLRARDR
jgi:hypothetical protein